LTVIDSAASSQPEAERIGVVVAASDMRREGLSCSPNYREETTNDETNDE